MFTIIGIDCSTNIRRNGLARGFFKESNLEISNLVQGKNQTEFVSLISTWINEAEKALLCLDAPLGWPQVLGAALNDHQAGERLSPPANHLFRRQTDKMIKSKLNKQPLDVGSNFIARTAHYALDLLGKISEEIGENVPLAWVPTYQAKASAVEVYPAATLLAHDIPHAGYKREPGVRKQVLKHLQLQMSFKCELTQMVENDDVFDAVLCVMAGVDFLKGCCIQPEDWDTAKKEGWIWVLDQDLLGDM